MKVVMGGIGTGGTGAPPSAIKLEGRIGGTGGTGAPPSATNVLMNELCGTGGTGAPPSAVRLELGSVVEPAELVPHRLRQASCLV